MRYMPKREHAAAGRDQAPGAADQPVLRGLTWVMAAACVAIGVVHLLLGNHSVPGLGAAGATVDSRERFYGAVFAGYGLAWAAAARVRPIAVPAVLLLAGVMLMGGLGRALSVLTHGWPHWFQVVLMVTELVLPPVYAGLAIATDRKSAWRNASPFNQVNGGRPSEWLGQASGPLVSMTDHVVDLEEKFGLFSEHWSPKVVATLNDYEIKLVRIEGEFVWHAHEDTDELFLVVEGEMTIQLRDRNVVLTPGQLFVVPRGVEHRPRADGEVKALLLEPAGVVNTGDAGGDLTAEVDRI